MLDQIKLAQQLAQTLDSLYKEQIDDLKVARELFAWFQEHPDILESLKGSTTQVHAPLWHDTFDKREQFLAFDKPYFVVATDGSQIYPDRHQGLSFYVLNTGTAQFAYGKNEFASEVFFSSLPEIVTQAHDEFLTEDVVNCHRAEREFEVGIDAFLEARKKYKELPGVFLCDGSLIFWHLENKSQTLKERFLPRYIDLLDQFFKNQIPCAGYISLPKSKELVALFRNCVAQKLYTAPNSSLEFLVDTDIAHLFLQKGERSIVFEHNSTLSHMYPSHLKPHFIYIHTGNEFARLEVPAWVAQDMQLIEKVVSIVADQCVKGNGYPVALSEAHEQAVISFKERDQFFALMQQVNRGKNYPVRMSQKSLKKRYVSI